MALTRSLSVVLGVSLGVGLASARAADRSEPGQPAAAPAETSPPAKVDRLVEIPKDAKPAKSSSALPKGVVAHEDIVFETVDGKSLKLDLYEPEGDGPFLGVLVVHGGGWSGGDKEKFRPIAMALAARGFAAASIDYRLSGEAKYPALIYDCKSGVRWMRANASKYHINPDRIGTIGGSAGGHMVALLATTNGEKSMEGPGGNVDQSSALQAAIVMGGPLDLTGKTGASPNTLQLMGKPLAEMPDQYAEASPIKHVSKTTPPFLFLEGELDGPRQNYGPFFQKLDDVGVTHRLVVFQNGKHGCWLQEPWATPMMDEAAAFLKEKLSVKVAAGR